MPLCNDCSEIDLRPLVAAAHERYSEVNDNEGKEKLTLEIIPHRHRKTSFGIRDSAELCDCCAVIWRAITKYQLGIVADEVVLLYVLFYAYFGPSMKTSMVLQVGNDKGDLFGEIQMYKCLSQDDPIATFIQPTLPKNSGSPGCLSKARQWLTACESSHLDCRRVDGNLYPLPTRVLRVGNDDSYVSLYETQGELGRWVALSYCWGSDPTLILTEETHAELLQGKPLSTFPATIRDATVIARALGEYYIWVDALCIMQDSKSDWEREAPRMSEIYANAVLTIINPEGDSTASGIFCNRSEYGIGDHKGPRCSLPWRCSTTGGENYLDVNFTSGAIILQDGRPTKADFAGPASDKHVWATRGWTLQEELLSWRTLTFMKKELLWGCPSTQVWESGQLRVATVDHSRHRGTESVRRVKPNLGLVKMSHTEHQKINHPSEHSGLLILRRPEIYHAWYLMVEEYSKRKLTKDTDKLMAIAGIAREVQGYIPDRYCAGVWENDLIAGLIWRYDSESWSHAPKGGSEWYKPFEANSDSRLPSWSWASINDEVYFRYKEQSSKAKFDATEQFIEVARVESLEIEYLLNNPYGPKGNCELVLTAPSLCCSALDRDGMQPRSELHDRLFRHLKSDPEYEARHKEHAGQKTIFQQLAWIQDFEIDYSKDMKRIPFPTCALLILESVHRQNLDTEDAEIDEKYRRVSFLSFADIGKDMTLIKQPPWPMKTIRMV